MNASANALHPLAWRGWAQSARSVASEPRSIRGAIIQRWAGSSRQMNQPPLNHHYIAVHMGGDKRVTRSRRTQTLVRDVPLLSVSTVEAGSAYRWTTEGPVDFAHIYIDPRHYAETVAREIDRDPASVRFEERIGDYDPLLSGLVRALVGSAESDDLTIMEREVQLDATLLRLYEHGVKSAAPDHRLIISPASVVRAKEYVAAHLARPITLDDLSGLAGYSRFHFARGFRAATGLPPYAYISRERIALACRLLADDNLPVNAVAAAAGFSSHAQFASRFRQLTGLSPSAFRRATRLRSPAPAGR